MIIKLMCSFHFDVEAASRENTGIRRVCCATTDSNTHSSHIPNDYLHARTRTFTINSFFSNLRKPKNRFNFRTKRVSVCPVCPCMCVWHQTNSLVQSLFVSHRVCCLSLIKPNFVSVFILHSHSLSFLPRYSHRLHELILRLLCSQWPAMIFKIVFIRCPMQRNK